MVMRTGNDTRGRKIRPGDHLHLVYQVGKANELAAWATPSLATRGVDLWEEQEDILALAHASGEWAPGTYRIVTHANYSGAEIGRLDRPMPLPREWLALTRHGTDELPAKGFAHNVLRWYPGTTLQLVGEHVRAFAAHYTGEIGTAELTLLTGYRLPEGILRPARPDVVITDDNR